MAPDVGNAMGSNAICLRIAAANGKQARPSPIGSLLTIPTTMKAVPPINVFRPIVSGVKKGLTAKRNAFVHNGHTSVVF